MGGAWLATHLWQHYLFTGDREFLARELSGDERRGRILAAWLVDDGSGHLVTAVGGSPENEFHYTDRSGREEDGRGISMGPTMDLAIVRELFDAVIRRRRCWAATWNSAPS